MAESTNTNIKSVYEPGWGETGPQKPENQVMVEDPIGLYVLNEKTVNLIHEELKGDYMPKNAILFADSESQKKQQSFMSVDYALRDLMRKDEFPKVKVSSPIPGGFRVTEMSPIDVEASKIGVSHTNGESGIKIPLENLIISQRVDATDSQYLKAREMLINKANETLQLFNADFRIPQFPSDDKLRKL